MAASSAATPATAANAVWPLVEAAGLDCGSGRVRLPAALQRALQLAAGAIVQVISSGTSSVIATVADSHEFDAWVAIDPLVSLARREPPGFPPRGLAPVAIVPSTAIRVVCSAKEEITACSDIWAVCESGPDAAPASEPAILRAAAHLAQYSAIVKRGAIVQFPQHLDLPRLKIVRLAPMAEENEGEDGDCFLHCAEATRIHILPVEATAAASASSAPSMPYADTNRALDDLLDIVRLPLLLADAFLHLGITCPKGVLLHGPPGTGKTLTVRAVAESCGAQIVSVRGPELFAAYFGDSERNVRLVFEQAEALARTTACILFIDEIDALTPRRDSTETHEARVVAQLLTLMDGIKPRTRLVVIGATNRPNSIDPAMRRPGRFDREIHFRVPTEAARLAILKTHCQPLPLSEDVALELIAKRAIGFVAADLAQLARNAAEHAMRRAMLGEEPVHCVCQADFLSALAGVTPSAMRGAEVRLTTTTWDDIGGLEQVKSELRQAIEWPLLYPETFERLGVSSPRGVLLFGPPGCSKTTLVRALANTCQSTFLSINGAQLYSPYVGDAERTLRAAFVRARASAPAIIFLDEVDALVGRREEGAAAQGARSVQERVLSTLLNEMDGIESAGRVLVVAATNRADMLDAAFLRPGRIDRAVYIQPPDAEARRAILRVHTRSMPLAEDVDLAALASRMELFSGADVENVAREAALLALREAIGAARVTRAHFEAALGAAKPSLTRTMLADYQRQRDTVLGPLAQRAVASGASQGPTFS